MRRLGRVLAAALLAGLLVGLSPGGDAGVRLVLILAAVTFMAAAAMWADGDTLRCDE